MDEARARVGDQWDLELTGLQLDVCPAPTYAVTRKPGATLSVDLASGSSIQGYLNSDLGYWRLAEGKSLPSAGIPGGQFGAASVVTQGKMGVAQIAEITEFHSELHTDAPIDFSQGRGLVA